MRRLALLLLLLAPLACQRAPADHQRLDGRAQALRDAFNADAGKVRLVMLVAPT